VGAALVCYMRAALYRTMPPNRFTHHYFVWLNDIKHSSGCVAARCGEVVLRDNTSFE